MGYKDDTVVEGEFKIDDEGNPGFLTRVKWFKGSRIVQLLAPIHTTLFTQDRFLVSNMDVNLLLKRNSDKFCLLNFSVAANPVIKLHKLEWFVEAVDILPSVAISLEKTLHTHTAKYPIVRDDVKVVRLSEGTTESGPTEVFGGQMPIYIIIGFLDPKALIGHYKFSPFNFQHFNVTEAQIVAGNRLIPYTKLEMDYGAYKFSRTYHYFLENLGLSGGDKSIDISMLKYVFGNCLYVFDLTPEGAHDASTFSLIRDGSITTNFRFKDPIPAGGIDMMLYAAYQGLAEINSFRNYHDDKTAV